MPLIKREIVPIFLSRQLNTQGAQHELESVTNKTLSNIILQLSSLSKHAEDTFGELYNEADTICRRSSVLQERIDKLSTKVTKLDATKDDVSLQDIQLRKAFKSSFTLDQEVVSSRTMPSAMRDTYMHIDKPPKLNILSQYREDGKDALKFYTDPKFFFELWCQEMKKNIQDIKHKRKNKKRNKPAHRNEQVKSAPKKANFDHLKLGVELQPNKTTMTGIGHSPEVRETGLNEDHQQANYHNNAVNSHPNLIIEDNRNSVRPVSLPPAPPGIQSPPSHDGHSNGDIRQPVRLAPTPPQPIQNMSDGPPSMDNNFMTHDQYLQEMNDFDFPPPTPSSPLDPSAMVVPPPPPPPQLDGGAVPPPPPPPPVGIITAKPKPITISTVPGQEGLEVHTTAPVSPSAKLPTSDPRSELLKAIERGFELKKVQAQEKAKQDKKPDNSVEAILSRRIAVELSDTDSSDTGGSSDWSSDDEL